MPTDRAAEMNFATCAECGHTNSPGEKTCAKCHSRLYQRCRRCGAKNTPEAKFCHSCARPMRKSLLRKAKQKIPSPLRKINLLPIILFLIFVPLGFKVIMFIVGALSGSGPAEE